MLPRSPQVLYLVTFGVASPFKTNGFKENMLSDRSQHGIEPFSTLRNHSSESEHRGQSFKRQFFHLRSSNGSCFQSGNCRKSERSLTGSKCRPFIGTGPIQDRKSTRLNSSH